MEEEKMPLWKRLAMEKGLIQDGADQPQELRNDSEKREEDNGGDGDSGSPSTGASRRFTSVRVYADSLPLLRRYATFSGNDQARSYAEILDALLGNWEKSYEVVNAPLERKRRELAKRNDSINDYCHRYMHYFLPISARNAIFVHQIIQYFADSIWNTFQSQSSQPSSRCPKELYAAGAQQDAFPVRIS